MACCKDPFHTSRQLKSANRTFNSIVNMGVRAAKAWEKEAKAKVLDSYSNVKDV